MGVSILVCGCVGEGVGGWVSDWLSEWKIGRIGLSATPGESRAKRICRPWTCGVNGVGTHECALAPAHVSREFSAGAWVCVCVGG